MSHRGRIRTIAVAALTVLTLASCGDDTATDPVDPDAEPEDGVEPLTGEPSTDDASEDGEFGTLAVTDVRVASHEGFDRVVFELTGDEGTAGWSIRYDEEPTSQGSGAPIEVDGEAYLAIAIQNMTLPPELPEGVEPWNERLAGPGDGVVVEVVSDTVYEGIHTFVVGTSERAPFLVERFEDPQRVVVDLFHGE